MKRGDGKEALCRAVVALVAREGLSGVTFRAVAREAGVTAGLASYHFGDRENMIREALMWAAQHSTTVARISPDAGDLSDFASTLPDLMLRYSEDVMFSLELILTAARQPELLPGVQSSYDGFIGAVRDSLDTFGLGQDQVLANLVFATLDGLTLQYLIYGDIDALRKGVSALQDFLRERVRRRVAEATA